MTDPWLTILGIGDNGLKSLTPAAQLFFEKAHHIIAPERVLESIPDDRLSDKKVTPWTSKVHETIRQLHDMRGEPVTILATGDPFHYGIAATLSRSVSSDEIRSIPHPSGFSLAANQIGWALQEVDCLSLHGRTVSRLQPFIEPGNRVLALTSNGKTVNEAAKLLNERGFDLSKITVLEHLKGKKERIVSCTVKEAQEHSFADFNMLAIECIPGDKAVIQPRVPGLPNQAFHHDGQLTKREVRAATLSALAPYPNALLWDIGAGCGSISIEWMRAARGAKAIAFEKNAARLSMIAENATALGTPGLEIVEGDFIENCHGHPEPDAIFFGGGLTRDKGFDMAFHALRRGGVLVANTVTLEGEAKLIAFQEKYGGDLIRMDVSHLTTVGHLRALDPRMSVLQWQVRKS